MKATTKKSAPMGANEKPKTGINVKPSRADKERENAIYTGNKGGLPAKPKKEDKD